jgi:hypothetical protein
MSRSTSRNGSIPDAPICAQCIFFVTDIVGCEAKDAYVYCNSPSQIGDLEAEADASRRVGLEADLLERAPLPFSTAGALRSLKIRSCKSRKDFSKGSSLLVSAA